jgi:hypothetical protein
MAEFAPKNPPTHLSMYDFQSKIREVGSGKIGGLAKQCRFAARILPQGAGNLLTGMNIVPGILQDMVYLCEATQFPGRGFMTNENRYYGPSFQIPHQTSYEPIDMTFICRNRSLERQFFDDWMEKINPTNNFDFAYKNQYWAQITVFQLSDVAKPFSVPTQTNPNPEPPAPVPLYAWTIVEAFPTQIQAQAVDWAQQDILRLTVTFAYRYWYRDGKDDKPFAQPDGTQLIL